MNNTPAKKTVSAKPGQVHNAMNGQPMMGMPNPGAPSMNEQQAAAAQLLTKLINDKKSQPVLTSLKELGIKIRVKSIMTEGKMEECLVVPIQELMMKEYLSLSGLSADDLKGDTE